MLPYLHIFGISIPSYGLCMALGMILAFLYAYHTSKKYSFSFISLIIIAVCPIGFGLLGAKLLYILVTYDFSEVVRRTLAGDTSIIAGDGLVFYGGLIGGIIGLFIGLLIAKEKFHPVDKIVTPCVPLGHAFGRIGCFMAGCCYGVKYDGFLSVTFPLAGVTEPVLPVQLFEAVLNLIIFSLLILIRKRSRISPLPVYFLMYSVVRFVLEFFRGDEIRGFANGLYTSQWISIGMFAAGAAAVSVHLIKSRRAKAA